VYIIPAAKAKYCSKIFPLYVQNETTLSNKIIS
jgi:hypothetical protein